MRNASVRERVHVNSFAGIHLDGCEHPESTFRVVVSRPGFQGRDSFGAELVRRVIRNGFRFRSFLCLRMQGRVPTRIVLPLQY